MAENVRRAQSCERKSALPVPCGSRHQRSSSVGPNTQNVYSTPMVRHNSAVIKSSTRGTSSRKYLGNVLLPIGNKDFQKMSVNKVRSYFQKNSRLHIPWSTFGSQPLPVATYVEMFNFLLKLLFKETNLDTKNYVDELPRCMKALGYPVNFQKSSLHTINTKTSWPSVLGMLVFLVDLVSVCEKPAVSEIVCPSNGDNQDIEVQREVFWHKLRIYRIWNDYTEGDDERKISEANQELKERLKSLLAVNEKDLNALEEEVKILEAKRAASKCTDLEEDVQMLQAKKSSLCSDEEKMWLEIQKLKNLYKERERQLEDKKNKIHLLEESSNKKRADIQRLEELCRTQEMTVEDRERNLQECQELRERIKDAEELCSSLKATLFQTDQEIAKLKTKVDNPYVELKTFQCANAHIPEVSGIKIGSRYSVDDWKYVKSELHHLQKQLVSKKLQLRKRCAELKEEVSMLKEEHDKLLQDERNGKRHLKELDDCIQKLKIDSKEIDANTFKKEEEVEKNDQILNEKYSQLQHITAELEDRKKQYSDIVSEGKQKIKEKKEHLKWMKDTLKEINRDFIEKSGYTGKL